MAARTIRAKPPSWWPPGRRNHDDVEPLVPSPSMELGNGSGFGVRREERTERDSDDVVLGNDDHDGTHAPDEEETAPPYQRRRRRRRRRCAGSPSGPSSSSLLPGSSRELCRRLVRAVVASRAVAWLHRVTRHECAVLLVLVGVSGGVAGLVQASLHDGHIVPWQMAAITALTVALFGVDQRRASVRFVVQWLALLLLVATPVLSGSSVLVMAVMVALPLQLLIHRFQGAVTLEACKVPPLARVKSIDVKRDDQLHSLVAVAYYTGHVVLWRVPHAPTMTASATAPEARAARGLEVCRHQPLRSVRFYSHPADGEASPSSEPDRGIVASSLLVAGDDGRLVQVDGATMSVERSVQAHSDFCRCVEVHPTHPVVLTASDDGSIKLWEEEPAVEPVVAAEPRQFIVRQVLEGHDDFVMVVKCHPDGTSIVSASLDSTILKWTLETSAYDVTVPGSAPSATFRGHSRGVNCLDFVVRGAASTVLVSGSDDLSIKLWDYSSGALFRSIPHAHADNVNAILVHPHLPILISACEGGICHVWNLLDDSNDQDNSNQADLSLHDSWNLNKGRAWALAWVGDEEVAIGFDQGCGIVRMKSEGERAGKLDPPSDVPIVTAQSQWLSHVDFVKCGDS